VFLNICLITTFTSFPFKRAVVISFVVAGILMEEVCDCIVTSLVSKMKNTIKRNEEKHHKGTNPYSFPFKTVIITCRKGREDTQDSPFVN
jgi:hypothetical protein